MDTLKSWDSQACISVIQTSSPIGNEEDKSVVASPYREESIPLTKPRSTAQITGCSIAVTPKGQCSEIILNFEDFLIKLI